MNFFKRSFTRSSLTPPVPQLRGRNAFICTDPDCLTVMERAPRGVCERCGKDRIQPVRGLAKIAELLKAAREKKEKEKADSANCQPLPDETPETAQTEEERNMNLSYFLTNCKK